MAKKDKKKKIEKRKSFLFLGPRVWAVALFLAVLTIAVFLPALNNNFVNWDDDEYVYENFHIQSIDLGFLKWMFTTFHASKYWHPLTWLSHAIDYAIWGLNPLGHHLTSIILHGLNTFLVVILIIRLVNYANLPQSLPDGRQAGPFTNGGAEGTIKRRKYNPSIIAGVITGLLFGIHPLHVESVAWVSERKDVLYALFFLLSILSYLKYASSNLHKQKTINYSLCLLFFILSLMSKPMAVTLPVVLIILDVYPLERLKIKSAFTSQRKVLIEKIPFICLSIISSVIIVMAHQVTITALEVHPLSERCLAGARALCFYLIKMLWPTHLVPLYPYPSKISFFLPEYLGASILVLSITALCIYSWRKQKIWSVVWAYYLVTLLPVLGIVQPGDQAAADRYSYIPSIGPFLLTGLVIAILFEKIKDRGYPFVKNGIVVFLPLALVFFLFSVTTISQIKIWKDSITLWTSVLKISPDCADAYFNRANANKILGKYNEALRDLDSAIMLNPGYPEAYNNRGLIRKMVGDYRAAMEDFSKTIELNPADAVAYSNRADLFMRRGEYQKGFKDLNKAIELEPHYAGFYSNRCGSYNLLGKYKEAIEDCTRAVEIAPQDAIAYNSRGFAFSALGNYSEAIADYNKSLTINPNPIFYFNRGVAYKGKGEYQMAVHDFSNAIKLNPKFTDAYINRGVVYGVLGELEHAIEDFTSAILLNPGDASAYYNRGAAYYRLDKKEDAMKDFQKAARLGDKTIQKILIDRGISW